MMAAAAAAAAVIAVVVLAAQVASLRGQLDRAHQLGPTAMAAAFDRATKVDGAREVGLQAGSGATLARVVLLPDGTGYLRGDHLDRAAGEPDVPTVGGDRHREGAGRGVGRRARSGSVGARLPRQRPGPRAFAVTVETAGGVVAVARKPAPARA